MSNNIHRQDCRYSMFSDPFSVTDLLLHLLHVMLTLSSFRSGQAMPFLLRTKSLQQVQQLCMAEEAEFNPIAILAHVFQELINGNALCQQIFCDVSWHCWLFMPLPGSVMQFLSSNVYANVVYIHVCDYCVLRVTSREL